MQVNTSMDSIFIFKCTWIGQENIFLLINQRYNSNKLCRHFYELENLSLPPRPPPLQSSISRFKSHKAKKILGRTLCSPKGQRDADSSISKIEATMDYSFLTLQFLVLQCIQEAQFIALQRGNGGSNSRIVKEFGRPRVKWFGLIWGKIQNYLALCTHPDVRGFEVKSRVYTRVWG